MAFKKEEFRAMIEREGISDFIFAKSWKDIEGTNVGLFEMINGRVGCVFEIFPTVYIGPKTEKKLASFYNGIDLPDKSSVQFFSFASRKIENFVEAYESLHSSPGNIDLKETLHELKENRKEWFLKYRSESIFSQGNDLRLRNFVNLVVITIPKEKGRGVNFTESEMVSNFSKVEQMLNEFSPRKYTRQQWVGLMREIFNPDSDVEYIPDDEHTELNYQVVDNSTVLTLEDEGMGLGRMLNKKQFEDVLKKESNAEHNLSEEKPLTLLESIFGKNKNKKVEADKQEVYANWHAKVFTTKMFPKTISTAEVSSKFYDFIGEKMTPTVPCPFFLSLTVYYENREKIKSEVGEKVKWNLWQTKSLGDAARFFPEILARAQEAEQINVMLHEGESPLYASWSCTIMDEGVQNVKKYGESLKKEFMRSNWIIQEEELIPHWIFLYSLPLNFDPYVLKDLAKRMNTLFTSNIASLTPILTGDKGSGAPVLNYVDRGGQLGGVNIFDSPTNYNFIVIGSSGSGKSYLMADFFTNYLMLGAKIRVIDVGRSYKHLCDVIGGQNIEFTKESAVCLNFFTNVELDDTGKIHEDEMQTIVPLVGLMAMQAVDTDNASDISTPVLKGFISKAVTKAFKTQQRNAGMQDVVEALEQIALEVKQDTGDKEQLLSDLINALHSFGHPDGEFYRYFNGENNLKFRSDFVVIELEEIDSKRLLKSVTLAAISHSINTEFFLGDLNQYKILVIDEAWSILENPIVSKFLETMARRIRKYKGASGIITQGFGDFDKSPETRAIYQNSAWKMFLSQEKDSITAARNSGNIAVDETLLYLMGTIKSNPPYYSEILMKNAEERFFVGRLMTDKVAHWIYTNHPNDRGKITSVMNSFSISEVNARLIIGYAAKEKRTEEEIYVDRLNAGKLL